MKTIRVAVMLAVSVTQQRIIGAALSRELRKREHRDQIEGEIFFTSLDDNLMCEQFQNMVDAGFDVIFTMGSTASVVMRKFYDEHPDPKNLPLGIFVGVKWPVEQGVVDSLRRPGGRITGIMREGAPPFLHARFISLLPFDSKRIAILHSRYGECGYITGKACMTQEYLERRGFGVDLYPVENMEEVLGSVHQLMRENKPDILVTFEGCETEHFTAQISDICLQNKVHYFGEGSESIAAGGSFGYGGHFGIFAHKAVLLIRKMISKELDSATTPILALPNNRTFFINQEVIDAGELTREWIEKTEKRLNTPIIVRKSA